MHQYIELLGYEVRDAVTKFAGVVVSVTFDLYGCVQVYVVPRAGKDGKLGEGAWFDHKRMEKTSRSPVMAAPNWPGLTPRAERGAQALSAYPGR